MGRAFEYRKAAKFARWDKMAKAFTRAGREIAMAIKEGGASPDTNSSLRRAIQNAKAAQMPKDRIEAAIKRASSKDDKGFAMVVYEGMGPHATALIVERLACMILFLNAKVFLKFLQKTEIWMS